MLDLLLWLLGFSLLLWLLLSLLAGRLVNPLGVFLGVLLAPVAFLIGVFLTGATLTFLALSLPWLLLAVPLALFVGFLLALVESQEGLKLKEPQGPHIRSIRGKRGSVV